MLCRLLQFTDSGDGDADGDGDYDYGGDLIPKKYYPCLLICCQFVKYLEAAIINSAASAAPGICRGVPHPRHPPACASSRLDHGFQTSMRLSLKNHIQGAGWRFMPMAACYENGCRLRICNALRGTLVATSIGFASSLKLVLDPEGCNCMWICWCP